MHVWEIDGQVLCVLKGITLVCYWRVMFLEFTYYREHLFAHLLRNIEQPKYLVKDMIESSELLPCYFLQNIQLLPVCLLCRYVSVLSVSTRMIAPWHASLRKQFKLKTLVFSGLRFPVMMSSTCHWWCAQPLHLSLLLTILIMAGIANVLLGWVAHFCFQQFLFVMFSYRRGGWKEKEGRTHDD